MLAETRKAESLIAPGINKIPGVFYLKEIYVEGLNHTDHSKSVIS